MARDPRAVHRAYARAHLVAGARNAALGLALLALAYALHRITPSTYFLGGVLAITLGVLGWRGGAVARGAIAGVLAGLPPLVVPSLVFSLTHAGHCASCAAAPSLPCMLACLGTSAVAGTLAGAHATRDRAPLRFALAALATAALAGLLGCGTTGLGGALGVIVGLAAGGVTGWRATKTLGYPSA